MQSSNLASVVSGEPPHAIGIDDKRDGCSRSLNVRMEHLSRQHLFLRYASDDLVGNHLAVVTDQRRQQTLHPQRDVGRCGTDGDRRRYRLHSP